MHRLALGVDPRVRGIGEQPLGAGAAAIRRPRRDVDRGRDRRRCGSRRAATPSLARIWQLAPGPADEPDVLYAGVEPAALFRSDDGGRSVLAACAACGTTRTARSGSQAAAGSASTPSSSTPTIPNRLLIAISAAGVYLSRRRRRVVAGEQPRASSPASCRTATTSSSASASTRCRATPSTTSASTCSITAGSTAATTAVPPWTAMTGIAGMDFGFPVVAHPTRPSTAYLLPLESDEFRCTPDGKCVVWRTADARRDVGAAHGRAPAGRRPPDRAPRRVHHRRSGPGRPLLRDPHPARCTDRTTTASRGNCSPNTCRR